MSVSLFHLKSVWLIARLATVIIIVASTSDAFAQKLRVDLSFNRYRYSKEPVDLNVPVGGSRLVIFDQPFERWSTVDPKIAEVVPIKDRRTLLIQGVEPGRVDLNVWDRSGRSIPIAIVVNTRSNVVTLGSATLAQSPYVELSFDQHSDKPLILKISVGQSCVFNFDQPIERLSIADPRVAEVIPISFHQALINGLYPGRVDFIAWDRSGRTISIVFTVDVQSNVVASAPAAFAQSLLTEVSFDRHPNDPLILNIPVSAARLLNFDQECDRVAVSDPKIAETVPISFRQVLINGLHPGRVDVVVWDKSGKSVFISIVVSVRSDVVPTIARIHALLLNHPYWSSAIGLLTAYILLLPSVWLILLWLRPLWLLSVSRFLSQFEPKLKQIIEVNLPVRPFSLISLFHFHPRVLNAWVRRYLAAAKENFASKQTVAQRKTYVPIPVIINEQMCDGFSVTMFQSIFEKKKVA
jgi:Flp pilus assembly secretin CpaC